MLTNKLCKGDVIGIISPSHIASEERYSGIISKIETLGFKVKTGKNIYKATYGYSASEQERADDLNDMLMDTNVKMIFFGGGEGSNELLPYINFDNVKKYPKLFCSYSDGTTILNAIYAKTGLETYYGQAPGIFEDLRHYDYEQFISHFCSDHVDCFVSNSNWITCNDGECEGVLTGGYTSNFALLMNSEIFHYESSGKHLLFLEDHEKFSDIARVSSFLSHIEQGKFIDTVTGLLFGHYSTKVCSELLGRLERFGKTHSIPVVYCDDFGHGINHAILPIGRRARLDANEKTMMFQ